MQTFQFLENALFLLSKIFFYPVVIFLFALLAYTFFSMGAFLKEAYLRWKNPDHYVGPFLTALHKTPTYTLIDRYEVYLNDVLSDSRKRNNQKIQAARYCVKMGPTLGLIGTLAPMATALSGLATGNLDLLSGKMISAFSTTILGLMVGGIAYTLAHIRIKWQYKDGLILSKAADQKFYDYKETLDNEKDKEIRI
ncbi:MAG: MotA/TolQ/ExbB proton channel family protein [Anditalea sp.]